jgi:hypothetical protein
MYQQHRSSNRIVDPMIMLARYEIEERTRRAAPQWRPVQVHTARRSATPTLAVLRRWLGARLPGWARPRQTPPGVGTTAEWATRLSGHDA